MRKELLKKMFRERHASLSLSINAIVVLIMAITMLGLGLAFMRNTFKSATSSMEGATAEIEKQTIESLKASGKHVGVSQNSLELGPKQKKATILAVTNTEDGPQEYTIVYNCLGATGAYESECSSGSLLAKTYGSDKLRLTFVSTFGKIPEDEAKTITFGAETTSGVPEGTITIEILVYKGDSTDDVDLHGAETVTLSTVEK